MGSRYLYHLWRTFDFSRKSQKWIASEKRTQSANKIPIPRKRSATINDQSGDGSNVIKPGMNPPKKIEIMQKNTWQMHKNVRPRWLFIEWYSGASAALKVRRTPTLRRNTFWLQSHQNESARLSTPRFSKWKQIAVYTSKTRWEILPEKARFHFGEPFQTDPFQLYFSARFVRRDSLYRNKTPL